MNAVLGKTGKKLFEKHLEQYAPQDPLYETYVSHKGKQKRRQREIPLGLSKRDIKILKSIRRRAHYLDKGFHIFGFRFGWNFFIGLIPVIGDLTNLSLNHFFIVRKAKQADIPEWLVRRMLLNNLISTGVGFVPFVGDVIVAVFKANSRNAALLEEFLRVRGVDYMRIQEEEAGRNTTTEGSTVQASGSTAPAKKQSLWRRIGVSEKDVEQVKPGAGLKAGEVASSEPVDPDTAVNDESGINTSERVTTTGAALVASTSPTVPGGLQQEVHIPKDTTPSPGRARMFSFFGHSGAKKEQELQDGRDGRGRFVENVDSD